MDADREALLLAVIDRQLEIERKARAWDHWRKMVGKANMGITWDGAPLAEVLDALERVVHPAQNGSTC